MNRELKVYFDADQKHTRRKQPAKFRMFLIRQAIIALQDLMKNKKDFAQLQQQIPHDTTKKPGYPTGLFCCVMEGHAYHVSALFSFVKICRFVLTCDRPSVRVLADESHFSPFNFVTHD